MTKNKTERQILQAKIKELKAKGTVSKKFDARQSNAKLAAEIARVEGSKAPGIAQTKASKKWTVSKTEVVSVTDAINYAEKKGYALQYSQHGFKLELYINSTGRPMKFMLPRDVVDYINQVAA